MPHATRVAVPPMQKQGKPGSALKQQWFERTHKGMGIRHQVNSAPYGTAEAAATWQATVDEDGIVAGRGVVHQDVIANARLEDPLGSSRGKESTTVKTRTNARSGNTHTA